MLERNIHYNTKERMERYTDVIKQHKEITPENKKLVLEFFELCKAQGLSNARLCKTLWQTRNLAIWIGRTSFRKATKQDIIRIVNVIQEKYPTSSLTVSDYKVMLKKMYKHMIGQGKTFPEVVEWVDTRPTEERKIDPSEIFTEEDILRIIAAENDPTNSFTKIRNKALIAFLYDSGVRIGELLSMRIGDIEISNDLWHITVRGKTGQRTFPIFPSIPYLKEYLRYHVRANDTGAVLWYNQNNPDKPISYNRVCILLKRSIRRAGIKKPCNPHNFRHSAVSRDATFMSDQKLKKKYGWSASSRQLRTYSHIRTEDLDNAYRKRYNLEEQTNDSLMLLKLCPYCHNENNAHESFCWNCRNSLDIKKALETKSKNEALEQLTVEFLKIMASQNPSTKVQFAALVKSKGLEELFK